MPVLNAATGMSSSTARACAMTSAGSMQENCLMPVVSCAVTAVTTVAGWQPNETSVRQSATTPAPPVGSVPPKTRTTGGVSVVIVIPSLAFHGVHNQFTQSTNEQRVI